MSIAENMFIFGVYFNQKMGFTSRIGRRCILFSAFVDSIRTRLHDSTLYQLSLLLVFFLSALFLYSLFSILASRLFAYFAFTIFAFTIYMRVYARVGMCT